MTPHRDEAERFLRFHTPNAVKFRYDGVTNHQISVNAAGRLIGALLTWAEKEIANHRDSH